MNAAQHTSTQDNREDRYLVAGDSRAAASIFSNLIGCIALAVTSPPYHNAISYDTHVADPRANYRGVHEVRYARDYLPLLDAVWSECHTLLAPGGHPLTISVGFAQTTGGITIAEALAAADQRMYAQKQARRTARSA